MNTLTSVSDLPEETVDDWASYPRDELLEQLGFVAPKKSRKVEPTPEPPAPSPDPNPEDYWGPIYYCDDPPPLPDLSALPPARGVGRPNQAGKAAARKAYEERQAAKATREPRDTSGRALPHRLSGALRAIYQTKDAE